MTLKQKSNFIIQQQTFTEIKYIHKQTLHIYKRIRIKQA